MCYLPQNPKKLQILRVSFLAPALTYRTLLPLLIHDKIEPLMFIGGIPGIGKSFELELACAKAGVELAQIAPGGDP
jgi:hypothetical protein